MNDHRHQYRRILIVIILVVIILAAAIGAGWFVLDNSYSREEVPIYFSGKIDSGGNAHFPDAAGNEVVIGGNVKQAERTADERYIITLYESGELVLMAGDGSGTVYIDDAVSEVYTVRDTGFIYGKLQPDQGTGFYCYRYEEDRVKSLGNGDFMPADYTLDLIAYDEGRIFVLTEGAAEAEEIATYDEAMEIELIDIAEGGKLAAWAEIDGNTHYIYIQDNSSTFFVDAVELEEEYEMYSHYNAVFGAGQEQIILVNTAFHSMYTKKAGAAVKKIDLGDEWYSSLLYSEKDLFYYDPEADVEAFFFEAGDETGYHIYYADAGTAECIIDEADNLFDIRNKTILYAADGDKLYRARLRNGAVIRQKQIAADVVYAGLSMDGRTMYYVREADPVTWSGTLYYRAEGEETEKISTAAEAFSVVMSSDGKSILYFEEVKYMEDEVTTYGDLCLWSSGKGSTVIAADVFRIQGIGTRAAEPDCFGYFTYKEQSDDAILCDYYYYDGKTSYLVAEDMLR